MKTNDPQTDAEFEAALEKRHHELIDHGDSFSVRNKKTGASNKLDADEYSDALFEAWNLVKPD